MHRRSRLTPSWFRRAPAPRPRRPGRILPRSPARAPVAVMRPSGLPSRPRARRAAGRGSGSRPPRWRTRASRPPQARGAETDEGRSISRPRRADARVEVGRDGRGRERAHVGAARVAARHPTERGLRRGTDEAHHLPGARPHLPVPQPPAERAPVDADVRDRRGLSEDVRPLQVGERRARFAPRLRLVGGPKLGVDVRAEVASEGAHGRDPGDGSGVGRGARRRVDARRLGAHQPA